MSARPWPLVAVKARAPACAAPMQAASAECSDSTAMYSAFETPFCTSAASVSMMLVCGVMG
jgi:hypothetical protein